jgi:hypothetical protein
VGEIATPGIIMVQLDAITHWFSAGVQISRFKNVGLGGMMNYTDDSNIIIIDRSYSALNQRIVPGLHGLGFV